MVQKIMKNYHNFLFLKSIKKLKIIYQINKMNPLWINQALLNNL